MASTGDGGGSLPPNFFLTPHQQNLLFAALNANNPQKPAPAASNGLSLSPNSFKGSPMQNLDTSGFQESPYLDNYDYDFGDSSFDFSFAGGDQPQMIGDVPGTAGTDSTENESNEKRSHPDDEEGDTSPGNDSKRRESNDKAPKKPGRKPLTSEPTSKRKAQNRAAQRAFRERKEKHLKDLETKVEELEKASEEANHENSKLRAQVDRITSELNQYKQRLAVMSNVKQPVPREKVPFGSAALNNLSDVSFQFEFPKFGALPGPPVAKRQTQPSQPISPPQDGQTASPARSQSNDSRSPQSAQQSMHDELANFSGIFTPSMTSSHRTGSRASLESAHLSFGGGGGGATSSPSASSNSNAGPSSSCGTSPEPSNQSPMGFKPLETLTTIGEEQQAASTTSGDQPFAQFANVDIGSPSFDWLANQNGGHFDPQLFGDYREPQDNILANPNLDDFFSDAFNADFFTPYNMPATTKTAPKKNLIDEIDAQQNSLDDEPPKSNMNCNQIWYDSLPVDVDPTRPLTRSDREKLQDCPKAQSGEFDLDGLCSELTKKAKCSGSGPVVGEKDFDTILRKYMGKDVSTDCVANTLGISVKQEQPNGVSMP
ncbi:DNA-binding transcription factor yap1 [Purpureocillium takamizusanense]|uniref:DNA-binding transcription factor yap1 n=1 Tax=Purpureocillium takamizusanense TaxID=2060973 RepID=A0A9Q8QNP9_9HYPO|nr:DNA-binding transcription factor yap1 [Purpureocillium takamizusanense]UNI22572.1 DNA-binding transcription factor yap1 [Purpureocillium takamizusanense]